MWEKREARVVSEDLEACVGLKSPVKYSFSLLLCVGLFEDTVFSVAHSR
jgi:hypothetical protein